ncbi:DMT family transporter [Pseudodesulfovibrio thermohalotolerans]|uniref:DMT family transporter n=1 Tax=Pseudodesulfovibrio thermohalotolerans TaxID=2880651 RepID=UPI0024421512|nr:DMT family transporter [Pseudodesulfovibrio thermohalotolerans]WFS64108.1 DMT family transporter [Pseudodesulfovibrio thermohalotolerans]
MTDNRKALLFGLATVTIWSTVASAFKIALRGLDPLQLLLCACAISIAALALILIVQGKLGEIRRMGRRGTMRCALLGALNPFLYYTILFKAYDLLPAQEAQPINYTWAVTLSLLSVPLLGQRLSLKDLGAIILSYLGVVVISTHGDPFSMSFSSLPGVGLALGSTVIWAVYWIFNTRSKADPIAGLLLSFMTGFPLILAATLLFSELPSLETGQILAASYVGLFEMGITFALWLTAMKYAAKPTGGGTARVANLIFLSPFLSLVFIHFLVGETIHPATVAGLAFIIAGNALMQYKPKKRA